VACMNRRCFPYNDDACEHLPFSFLVSKTITNTKKRCYPI
jgi:hypothetical protein